MRDERAEDERRAVVADAGDAVDAVDRDDGVGQRRLPLPGADHQIGAAGDRARATVDRRESLLDGGGRRERAAHVAPSVCASHTRSGVIGSLRTWRPSTLAIAFATAPAVGTCGGSPTPLDPRGPTESISIHATSISGASEQVTSL